MSLPKDLEQDALVKERDAYRIIAKASATTTTIEELCDQVLSGLLDTLEFDKGLIRIYQPRTDSLDMVASIGFGDSSMGESHSMENESHLGVRVGKSLEPLLIDDVSVELTEDSFTKCAKNHNISSMIIWPLVGAEHELIGVISIVSSVSNRIKSLDITFFEMVVTLFESVLDQRLVNERLKESEQRFLQFANYFPGPLFIKDSSSRVIFVNNYMMQESDETVPVGIFTDSVFSEQTAREIIEDDRRVLTRGPIEYIKELSTIHGIRYFWVIKFPIRLSENEQVIGGLSLEITENIMTEMKLDLAIERAEFLLDLMAHDLSNMQQGIVMSLEMLLEFYNLDPKIRELVEGALSQTEYGVDLIQNVRSLSRIDHRSVRVHPIDPYAILVQSIEMVVQSFPHRELQIIIHFHPNKFRTLVDEFLVDVFFNLLHNVVKIDSNETVEIDIFAELDDDYLIIRIEDHGPGLSPNEKAVISKQLMGEKVPGRGLGLYLTGRILRRQGGSIMVADRVRDDPSRGACFVIKLPLAD